MLKQFLNSIENKHSYLLLLPYFIVCLIFLIRTFNFPIHDFAVGYFSGHLIYDNMLSVDILYDIFNYNEYIWNIGYAEIYVDYYVNTPFLATLFYPIAALFKPFTAKLLFNVFSIVLFSFSFYRLVKYLQIDKIYILLMPLIFIIPIKNNILFGQFYLLLSALLMEVYLATNKGRNINAGICLSLAIHLKIFPVLVFPYLILTKRWRTIATSIVFIILLTILSICITGIDIWQSYLFNILPLTNQNGTSINYAINAQSALVFLKFIFNSDALYNPNGYFDLPKIEKVCHYIFSALLLTFTLQISLKKTNPDYLIFGSWLLFALLIQPRMVSYTKILFVIPLIVLLKFSGKEYYKSIALVLLFVACNFLLRFIYDFPLLLKWPNLLFLLLFATVFYIVAKSKLKYRLCIVSLMLLAPSAISIFQNNNANDKSYYALNEHKHFYISNYFSSGNRLSYNYLSKEGIKIENTNISVESLNSENVEINNNQIYYDGQQITYSNDLKDKASVLNAEKIIYLSDKNSRRKAYTIRLIDIN